MDKLQQLIRKGVTVPDPRSVFIGDDVAVDRISGKRVVLYPGTRIEGARTFVATGVRIGAELPATVVNCYLGPDAALKGGYFEGAVFLSKSACGSGAHVRPGTILEEEASTAHTVGLKHTILFPFVTLGSLINFCDCLMSGGTGRDNHSEVGSAYIHFNFTPNQDKATPSLIGDVPKGVMLSQPPIFLGGQGGLVGPCRLAFGTVTAAGMVCRHDQLKENHLVLGSKNHSGSVPYTPGSYINLKRILNNNFYYIGNLYALLQWYTQVRACFVGPGFPERLLEGLRATLQVAIAERIGRLERLADKLALTASKGLPGQFAARWPEIHGMLSALQGFEGEQEARDDFMLALYQHIDDQGRDYVMVIRTLDPLQAAMGTRWLSSIVLNVTDAMNRQLQAQG